MKRCDAVRRLAKDLLTEISPDGRVFQLTVTRAFDDDGLEYFAVSAAVSRDDDRPWSVVDLSRRLNSRINTAGLGGFATLSLRPAPAAVPA